jgi:C-methyltransferase C-terminal domain/Methyltransferase domain/Putative zinc binding domain
MQRELCGGCRSTNLQPVLDLGDSPLANDYPTAPTVTLTRYPLGLVRCHRCTLVQHSEVVPDEELWNREYAFYTGGWQGGVQQQKEYARALMLEHPFRMSGLVVEIACNDGSLLRNFHEIGLRTLGVDPARGPAAKAQELGLTVRVEQFGMESAEAIVAAHGQASLIIANNVIAHVADLDDFVGGMATLLKRNGAAVIEFQYLTDLITGNQFDHVYHEHRSFFSLTSLALVLGRHDLRPVSVRQTSPQGGSLQVTIQRMVDNHEPDDSVHNLFQAESWLKDPSSVAGLQGRANRIRDRFTNLLSELHRGGKRVAGYGAPAKSATLLNFCDVGPTWIQYVVDATPAKWGRYTPGTNIPIINPASDSRAPDVYVLFAWSYAAQIFRREAAFTGNWLVPIPLPELM